MRQARLKHHRAFCRCWMLLAVFIAATIYAIHHDCERRIKRLRKASGRKSGSANERAATAQQELEAARAKETSTLETLGATREELRGERQTIEQLRATVERQKGELEAAAEVEAQLEKARADATTLQQEIERLQDQVQTERDETERLKAKRDEYKQKNAACAAERDEVSSSSAEQQKVLSTLREEVTTLGAACADLSETREALVEERRARAAERKTFEKELQAAASYEAENAACRVKLDAVAKDLEAARAAHAEHRSDLETQIKSEADRVAALEKQHAVRRPRPNSLRSRRVVSSLPSSRHRADASRAAPVCHDAVDATRVW